MDSISDLRCDVLALSCPCFCSSLSRFWFQFSKDFSYSVLGMQNSVEGPAIVNSGVFLDSPVPLHTELGS